MTLHDQYFLFCCEKGLRQKGLWDNPEYRRRLDYEVDIITKMGFCEYFLTVMNIIKWAKKEKIPIGTGRGSAAGSLASYCLGITALDPIRYGLYFERFLDITRTSSPPDIDLDFSEERRHEVIQYLIGTYGEENVCHIGTFGLTKAKSAIRDVCRTLGHPYEVGDKLAKMILPPVSGKEQSLDTSYEKVPELARYRGSNTPEGEILRFAEKIEGRPRVFSTHASGYIVANKPVMETVPLARGKEEQPTAAFDMKDVEEAGLIKFDLLGLRALDAIDRTLNLVEKNTGVRPDPLEFPLDDSETYDLLCAGDVEAIFQLEASSGLRDLTVRMKPKSLEDLCLLVSGYRPGPLASGLLDDIVKVRDGVSKPNYLLPELEPILQETAGAIIYQEQAMRIARDLAGFTLAQSNTLRRAIGKKLESLMKQQKEEFINGMAKGGFTRKKAVELFDIIEQFADYSFNKSHGISYGYISYQTAYLKAHYPLEHICACLISDSDEQDKITKYIGYCKKKGIGIFPPDINESDYTFTLSRRKNGIRFGLAAIKNVGVKPAKKIMEERDRGGPYLGLIDFCVRANPIIDKEITRSLVLAGAFDEYHDDRQSMLDAIEDAWRFRKEYEGYHSKLATYEKRIIAYRDREDERRGGSKKPSLKLPKKLDEPKYPIVIKSLTNLPILDKLRHEHNLLGCFISGHPITTAIEKGVYRELTLDNIPRKKRAIAVLAVPVLVKEITTRKKKEKMAYVTLQDETGNIDVVIFPSAWRTVKPVVLNGGPAYYNISIKRKKGEETLDLSVKEAKLLSFVDGKTEKARLEVPIKRLYDLSKAMSKKLRKRDDKKVEEIELIAIGEGFEAKMGSYWVDVAYLPLLQRQAIKG